MPINPEDCNHKYATTKVVNSSRSHRALSLTTYTCLRCGVEKTHCRRMRNHDAEGLIATTKWLIKANPELTTTE